MKSTQLDTILWLSDRLDDINAKATLIGEMLLEETNQDLMNILDKKLAVIENDYNIICQKIKFEQKLLNESLS